jgi:hypothetical protein
MADDAKTQKLKEQAEKAVAVSDRVQLMDVRLLESKAEQKPIDDDLPQRMVTKVLVDYHVDNQEGTIDVFPHLFLHVKRDNAPEEILIRIEARFAITYAIHSTESLTPENYEAFSERNAVFNIWPYWREFVQSTTVRMGLPALTLPVFRVGLTKLEQSSFLPRAKPAKQISDGTNQQS